MGFNSAYGPYLKFVENVGDSLLSDQLEANLYSFFNWGLLSVGGYTNITLPESGTYGGFPSQLRCASDPNYEFGQVWEAFRKDWVWETGVPYTPGPISVSGVWVNGVFHSNAEMAGTGVYSGYIDYPNGRVVFNNPISTSGQVQAEYSYRTYQFYTADCPWWMSIQPDSMRVDNPQFLQQGSGAWDILGQSRVQLPAVVIEAVPRTSRFGKEIGQGGADIVNQDVLFHIISEDRWSMKWIHDAITYQWQKRLAGYDKNQLLADNVYPLNANGSINPSGLSYPIMTLPAPTGYYWAQIRLEKMGSQSNGRLGNLHYATVKCGTSVDLLPIGQ